METLIKNGTLVTMDASHSVIRADLLIEGSRIKKIARRIGESRKPRKVIDAGGKVVMPGLIQAHIHLCQTLFRNRADGLQLLDWLKERIWPFEAAHDERSMRASADLGIAELLKGGTTALQDMGTVHHYDQAFEAAAKAGIRMLGGKAMMDAGSGAGVPKRLKETTRGSLDESIALAKRWHGAEDGRLAYAFCPRFVLSCTEDLMREVARIRRGMGARIHTHASENKRECQVVKEIVGKDNIDYFHSIGLSGDDVSLAHCVHATNREIRAMAKTKTNVVHCPAGNLKLASGIARIPEMLAAGVPVSLGADGAPCNNNLDAFLEMRFAALLQKPRLGELAMPPEQVLELATMGGARALGMEKEIGSLEVGKRADIVLLDLRAPHVSPAGEDVHAMIVYGARPSDVHTVLVDGRVVVDDHELLTLDEEEVVARANEQIRKVEARVNRARA